MRIENWALPEQQCCTLENHTWSVPRLFELARALPVMEVPLEHLNISYTLKNLRLRDFVMHMRAVEQADLEYPIILDEDGDIMDGRHRVMKALWLGLPSVKAVRFEKNPSPCRIKEY